MKRQFCNKRLQKGSEIPVALCFTLGSVLAHLHYNTHTHTPGFCKSQFMLQWWPFWTAILAKDSMLRIYAWKCWNAASKGCLQQTEYGSQWLHGVDFVWGEKKSLLLELNLFLCSTTRERFSDRLSGLTAACAQLCLGSCSFLLGLLMFLLCF